MPHASTMTKSIIKRSVPWILTLLTLNCYTVPLRHGQNQAPDACAGLLNYQHDQRFEHKLQARLSRALHELEDMMESHQTCDSIFGMLRANDSVFVFANVNSSRYPANSILVVVRHGLEQSRVVEIIDSSGGRFEGTKQLNGSLYTACWVSPSGIWALARLSTVTFIGSYPKPKDGRMKKAAIFDAVQGP